MLFAPVVNSHPGVGTRREFAEVQLHAEEDTELGVQQSSHSRFSPASPSSLPTTARASASLPENIADLQQPPSEPRPKSQEGVGFSGGGQWRGERRATTLRVKKLGDPSGGTGVHRAGGGVHSVFSPRPLASGSFFEGRVLKRRNRKGAEPHVWPNQDTRPHRHPSLADASDPDVAGMLEKDREFSSKAALPNDPLLFDAPQWELFRERGINAVEAWRISRGTENGLDCFDLIANTSVATDRHWDAMKFVPSPSRPTAKLLPLFSTPEQRDVKIVFEPKMVFAGGSGTVKDQPANTVGIIDFGFNIGASVCACRCYVLLPWGHLKPHKREGFPAVAN